MLFHKKNFLITVVFFCSTSYAWSQDDFLVEALVGYRFPIHQNEKFFQLENAHKKRVHPIFELILGKEINEKIRLNFKSTYYVRRSILNCVYWPLPSDMIPQLARRYIENYSVCSHKHSYESEYLAFSVGGERVFQKRNFYISVYGFFGFESLLSSTNISTPILDDREQFFYKNTKNRIVSSLTNELGTTIGFTRKKFDFNINAGMYIRSLKFEEVSISNSFSITYRL